MLYLSMNILYIPYSNYFLHSVYMQTMTHQSPRISSQLMHNSKMVKTPAAIVAVIALAFAVVSVVAVAVAIVAVVAVVFCLSLYLKTGRLLEETTTVFLDVLQMNTNRQ